LAERFGDANVFIGGQLLDGVADSEAIARTLGSVDIILAVIGPRWLRRDKNGLRRIDDPTDYVGVELEAALTRGIPVIPVLVEDAELPDANDLPDRLRPSLQRDRPVSLGDRAWDSDVAKLLHRLEKMMVERPPRTDRDLRRRLREAALAGVVPAFRVAAPPPSPPAGVVQLREPVLPSEPSTVHRSRAPEPAPSEVADLRSARYPVGLVPLGLIGAGFVGLGLVVAKWLLGWLVGVEPVEVPRDTVVCTVFAPPSGAPGESLLVQAFAHLPEQAADASAIASELDTDAQRRTFQSLQTAVPLGGRLDFELRMPGLEVDEPVASLVWHLRAEAVQFGVRIPPETPEGTVISTLDVSINAAPVGHVKFKLVVAHDAAKEPNEPQGERARRYRAAFISYASKDREKVLARAQMLSIVGIRYFQDVLSLEPGDRWAKKLELGIDDCDLFLLFWSSESKQSEWVRKEVRYALNRRGDDELAPPEIRPIILEGPPIVEPWEELAHLHFNDRLLYFMNSPGA